MKRNYFILIMFLPIFFVQTAKVKASVNNVSEELFVESQIFTQFEAIRSNIQLIPFDPDKTSRNFLEKWAPRLSNAALLSVAQQSSFSSWRQYEDEHVSFFYPAHPDISLEIQSPQADSGKKQLLRLYRLKLGDKEYCAFGLFVQTAFDDGLDAGLWAPFAYEKCMFHHGAIYRFSFRNDGRLVYIQMLCKDRRLLFSAQTMIPMHEDIYLKMAMGVQMKNGPWDQPDMQQYLEEVYGFQGRVWLLEKGMLKADIIKLLGNPQEVHGEMLLFVGRKGQEEFTAKIRIENGVLREIQPGFLQHKYLSP